MVLPRSVSVTSDRSNAVPPWTRIRPSPSASSQTVCLGQVLRHASIVWFSIRDGRIRPQSLRRFARIEEDFEPCDFGVEFQAKIVLSRTACDESYIHVQTSIGHARI